MNHRKPSRRWPHVLVAAAISMATIGLTAQVQAASATPAPVCSNGLCTITFDYSGDVYVYTPPTGIRTMSFELTGAQGGRVGGLGGKVAGTFSNIPSTMNIYVGGAGKQGASAAGGYNGGGAAGGSHGDEGSGGGASDIRLTSSLDDRIVVAGGGGGTGGWIGMAGGAGGGLLSTSGTNSIATGGGGGTQVAGGSGGIGSAATSGSAGAKGVGGVGGIGAAGGGGGGGGGLFGGGGGGADGVIAGTDGAGGGGGSSFASANYTKSITHSAGIRSGNGQVILTYAYAPAVSAFAPASTSSNQSSVPFNLTLTQNVVGLETTDFGFAGTAGGCFVSALTGSGSAYTATISGCSDGTVGLTLATDSITGATLGPIAQAASTLVTLDRKNPGFTIVSPTSPSNQASIPFTVSSDEPVTGLSASSFSASGTGCSVGSVSGAGQVFTVNVVGCASGATAVLTLKANSANDLNLNAGPISAFVASGVLLDLDVPTPIAFAKSASTRAGLVGFELSFAEPVTGLTTQSFTIHGDGCAITKLSGSKDSYALWLTDCAQGTAVSATLKAGAAQDVAGNLGPAVPVDSTVVSIDDVAPTATLTVITRSPQPVFEASFSEPVQGIIIDSFSHSGTATGCHFALSSVLIGLTYRVSASNCSSGTIKLVLPAQVAVDATGNLGPAVSVSSDAVTLERSATQGGASPAHLHSFRLARKNSSERTDSNRAPTTHQTKKVNRIMPHRNKLVPVTTKSSDFEVEPVNRTLGFAALALAGLLLGSFAIRRLRR